MKFFYVTGVCCKEITELDGKNEILASRPRIGIRAQPILSDVAVLRAIDIGESAINNITNIRLKSTTIKKAT